MDINSSLENLYISPLELCNLNCQSCYTLKTKNILSNDQILDFVNRYQKIQLLKSIIFCGGEVFTLPDFPELINQLIDENIFISIITNGTIDRLNEIKSPHNCQLIVSLDGPKEIHDNNRGIGNFDKSIKFIEHVQSLDFPVEIFYLVTNKSYEFIKEFSINNLPITYLTDRLGSLTTDQVLDIKRNYPTYPVKNLGCSQISLQSNGLIYGCCETNLSIGKITDPIEKIIKNYLDSFKQCQKCEANNFSARSEREGMSPKVASTAKIRLPSSICNGCCDPEFLCGYKKELQQISCKDVIKLFNDHQ